MNDNQQHINYLWKQFAGKQATTEELDELFHYLQQAENDETSHAFLQEYFAGPVAGEAIDREYWLKKLEDILNSRNMPRRVHRVHFLKASWFRYAAAVIVIASGAAIWWANSRSVRTDIATTNDNKQLPADVAPGGNRAVLTLADGTQIVLDDAANGNLAQQGNTRVIKLDNGQLAYNAGKALSGELLYNTISTPKGGQYQIVLPDGSKVWLNAASSIKFPAAFVGAKRNVEITGEVYLEVAKNLKQPFSVNAKGAKIDVLGTSFNVSAYEDENGLKTTLIDGGVKVLAGGEQAVLKPGQQAVVGNGSVDVRLADIGQTLAWKNGLFQFNRTPLADAMRQLSRWYDVNVVYQNGIPDIKFSGDMKRDLTLSQVLDALGKAGVKFRIEGKRLIVM